MYVYRIEDTSKTDGRNVFGEENRHATEPSHVMTLSSLCHPLGPQPSFPITYGSIRP